MLMPGTFHLLMMFLGAIEDKFGDAGLRDLAVQSGIISEGSVDNASDGYLYSRAVRMHKLVYEALIRILKGKFTQKESWSEMKEPTKTRRTPLTVCKYLV